MPENRLVDTMHRRAARGEPRGADAVWAVAIEPTYALPPTPGRGGARRSFLAAAAVILVVAVAFVAILSRTDIRSQDGVAAYDGALPAWALDPPDGTTVVIAFLDIDDPVSVDQRRAELMGTSGVLDGVSVTRAQAYDEFLDLFSDDPDMVGAVTADVLPESVQLLVEGSRATEVEAELWSRPGVWRVVRTVDRWSDTSSGHGFDSVVPEHPGRPSTSTIPTASITDPPECMVALVYLTSMLDLIPIGTPTWDTDVICRRATAGLVR